MLNRSGDSGHPCLVPDFRGTISVSSTEKHQHRQAVSAETRLPSFEPLKGVDTINELYL
jgi:hypothetical protein